jgi:hypothetical protein
LLKTTCGKKEKGKKRRRKKATEQIGTNVMARVFNARLLARSQFVSARTGQSWFSVVFLGPRANAELEHKFHVARRASHAILPMVILKISPCTNVTLALSWTALWVRAPYMWKKEN